MFALMLVSLAAFVVCYLLTPRFVPLLREAGILGKDMNKEGKPQVAEMGGIVVTTGFVVGVLIAIGLSTFNLMDFQLSLPLILAPLSTVLIMALIGIFDDMFDMRQRVKAMLPVFAALPLIAVKAGVTEMNLPIFGVVDFGILYALILIPVGITGASNAMNMLAGFNGLEAGLGIIMCATIGGVSLAYGTVEGAVISLAMLGALLGFIRFNWFPAKILIGDVGTLTIGAVVASSVIVGNVEYLGLFLIAPFVVEFVLKARSRFSAESWCDVRDGLLVCSKGGEVYGLGRLVMYLSGGVSEKKLVLSIILVEAVFALAGVYAFM